MKIQYLSIISFLNDLKIYDEEQNEPSSHPLLLVIFSATCMKAGEAQSHVRCHCKLIIIYR